ncbi:MAG: hypothetical protein HZA92_12090 [Verrucomicrobia bacterium]|nr:hypothetical protein [Verrucomicrobiota bacterium]
MKTSPASIRGSWAYKKWGARGVKLYLNVVFGAMQLWMATLLAGFIYFTFFAELVKLWQFAVACCFVLIAEPRLFRMHRDDLRELNTASRQR